MIHDYVKLDMNRVVEALDELQPIEEFFRIVHRIAREEDWPGVG